MSEKYNYNEFTPNQTVAIYTTGRIGNTFTPGISYDLDYIIIKGARVGNCGNVDLDIYLADGNHKPTGGSLVNVQIAQGSIPTDLHSEITFTLGAALSLTAAQEYAYIIKSAGTDAFNSFLLSRKIETQSDYYLLSSDSGSSWTTTQALSIWYQIWGTTAGNNPVDTPSPADSATGQQSGSVDLSWADPNDPDFDDYEIYFGPTGSMVLVETGYGNLSLTIADDMILGQEYSWRIDGNDGENVVTGSVWTFTIEAFAPPSTNLSSKKRLIVASNDEIWYEDVV